MANQIKHDSTAVIVILFLTFLVLLLALFIMYRKLNRIADGRYAIPLLFTQARERLRTGVGVVESRFGLHIWPGDTDVERGSERSASLSAEKPAKEQNRRDEEETREDSDDDYSSMDGCELRELSKLRGVTDEEDKRIEERGEGEREREAELQPQIRKGADGERGALRINLKQFSGSAIWLEEKTSEEDKETTNLTIL